MGPLGLHSGPHHSLKTQPQQHPPSHEGRPTGCADALAAAEKTCERTEQAS